MKRMLLFLLLLSVARILWAQSMTQQLNALLNDEVLRTSEVGITVFDLTTGQSLYRYQDEKLYRPASIQKVITSVTTLATLGTDYTLNTRLGYTGRMENDTLKGNLYLIGGFDPELMEEDLDRLVEAVSAQGIRHVTDTVVADVSFMDSVYWGPGWSWDDAPYAFQPYLSPLMLNRGCVDVRVVPTQKDSLPILVGTPASSYYTLHNQAVSQQPQAGKLTIERNWMQGGNIITVAGNAATTRTETLSLHQSQAFFFHTFLERLQQRGIHLTAHAYADSPDTLTVFHTLRRPLEEVLTRALKKSDNLCAEALFYHLGAHHAGHKRVSAADGTDAILAFMKTTLGMNPEYYQIADGSGVSLYNYISPRLLLEYLKYAYYHRDIFLPLYEALPVAGVDGTLQYRMKQTKARGNVHAKTGSVTGVSSLAGYVKASNGHQLAFVIIHQNVLKTAKARALQDKICAILAR